MDVRFFGNNTNYQGQKNIIYQKQLNAISGVTNFAKEINTILTTFKDSSNLITSVPDGQQFPFYYRADSNIRKIFSFIPTRYNCYLICQIITKFFFK